MNNIKEKVGHLLLRILDVFKSKFISDSVITLIATLIAAVIGFVINIIIAKIYNEEILIYNQVYSLYNTFFLYHYLFSYNRL